MRKKRSAGSLEFQSWGKPADTGQKRMSKPTSCAFGGRGGWVAGEREKEVKTPADE